MNWFGMKLLDLERLTLDVNILIRHGKHRLDLAVCGQVLERVRFVATDSDRREHDACFQLHSAIDGLKNRIIMIL
jgi:hypothetical protein